MALPTTRAPANSPAEPPGRAGEGGGNAGNATRGGGSAGHGGGDRSVTLARLATARFPLVAAGLVALVALAAGASPLAAVAGYGVVLAAAAFGPRRSGAQRLAERAAEIRASRRPAAPNAVAIVDALPDPAFLLDPLLAIAHQNAAATAVFGESSERMGARLKFRSPEIRDALESVVRDRAEARVPAFNPPGTQRWFAVRATPMHREDGSGRGHVLLHFREETERRREERLRADFVANASHELRTPLASLTGFIETLQGPARDDREARERFLAIMAEQAHRMGRLLDDLMSLSRLERRAHVAPDGAVDLAEVVAHVVDAARPLAGESGVELILEGGPGTVVTGDRDQLIQVVENMVENALRYGASGGRVEVGVASAGDLVEVAVRDHGPGIAPEHLPRLTERFYRVDVASSRAARGTGLGLAIVKHILARHGSRLRIESRPGEGARFSFTLPPRGGAGSK